MHTSLPSLKSVRRTTFALASLATCLAVQCAQGQTTDVADKVDKILTAYGPVAVTRTIQVPQTREVCHEHGRSAETCSNVTVYVPRQSATTDVLKASNIHISSQQELTFAPMTRHELPDQIFVKDGAIHDCTAIPATQQITLSQTFQRSTSVALTKSVSNTIGASLSTSYKFMEAYTATLQLNFSHSSTEGSTNTVGSQDSVTLTQTGTITVPGHSAVMAELRAWPVHFTVPFHANVTVDADISANDKGITLLSQILSPDKRSFVIEGTLEANAASEGHLVFYDLPFDPAACGPTPSIVVDTTYVPKNGTKITERSR